jgi:exonuclease III
MSANHILVWNVRGLNSHARRNVVQDLVEQQCASIVCLQESKLEHFPTSVNIEVTGFDYDHAFLPANDVAGGVAVAWRRDLWRADAVSIRTYSITVRVSPLSPQGEPWWLTTVYDPTEHAEKRAFL